MLYRNQLDLQEDKPIDGNVNDPVPFVFVGDEAFRLSNNLMKPYPRRDLDIEKWRYNYRLSHARQLVDCSFGILVSKFRIFKNSIAVFPDRVDKIIKTACALHNMIRMEENTPLQTQMNTNIRPNAFQPVQNIRQIHNNHSTRQARAVREKFCNYFSGMGVVQWQGQIIGNNGNNIEN